LTEKEERTALFLGSGDFGGGSSGAHGVFAVVGFCLWLWLRRSASPAPRAQRSVGGRMNRRTDPNITRKFAEFQILQAKLQSRAELRRSRRQSKRTVSSL
jgi:hypothetical protein